MHSLCFQSFHNTILTLLCNIPLGWDLPSGPVVKNPPAKQGMWIPSLVVEVRAYMPQSNKAHTPQLRSPLL